MQVAFQMSDDKSQQPDTRTTDGARDISPSPWTERGPGVEVTRDAGDLLSDAYRLAGDLLAYPEDVDTAEIEGRVEAVARALGERVGGQTAGLLRSFFEDWKAITPGEYIDTLELSPRCPLYLGYWAFLNEGPDSPPRRRFMGRLIDIYRRFDLSLGGKELPDFLPVVTEFLWVSLGKGEDEARRQVIEKFALPWMPSMVESLEKMGSPYCKLLKGIQNLMEWDVHRYSEVEVEASEEVLGNA